MAALAFFQLGWGWWMGRLPVGGDKVAAYDVHFAVGVLMLVLAVGRGAWRLLAPGPINDADKPGWESTAAHITHYVFYLCLLALPLSGWAMISATARDQDLALLGMAPWPLMPLGDLSNPRAGRSRRRLKRCIGASSSPCCCSFRSMSPARSNITSSIGTTCSMECCRSFRSGLGGGHAGNGGIGRWRSRSGL
jgi:cytochrome b561